MGNLFTKRFEDVAAEMDALAKTRIKGVDAWQESFDRVAEDRLTTWIVRAESLIANAREFSSSERGFDAIREANDDLIRLYKMNGSDLKRLGHECHDSESEARR